MKININFMGGNYEKNTAQYRHERVKAIELMSRLEEIQGQLDDIKDLVNNQIEAIEDIIQELINDGTKFY